MSHALPKVAFLLTLSLSVPASAHYLWVAIDRTEGEHGTAKIFFEESPAAKDGRYLDPFVKNGQTWIRTVDEPKPERVKTAEREQEKLRWISAELPASRPRSIDSYFPFGVYQYGKTNVLLHYYARNLDVDTHEDLHELAGAEQMKLDIVPHDDGKELELTVLWQGQPLEGRTVHIRGPQGLKQNPKTDSNGRIRFSIDAAGRYTFRTSAEEDKPGELDGQDYSLIRHSATLVMTLPLTK